jgi:predicted SAM-dependent methyltransferase
VGTLQKLPFPDGAFSVVVMKHVLEHTPAPRAAMAEVHRVLSSGGVAVIAVPNLDYWKGKYLRRTYRYFRPDDLGQQHYVYYTRQTLTALLERCGFRVAVSSKSHWRAKRAHKSAARLAYETLRFSMLTLWQFCARSCRMQREIFAIAVKR